jgi:hypothetical protein
MQRRREAEVSDMDMDTRVNELTGRIVDAAYHVHVALEAS